MKKYHVIEEIGWFYVVPINDAPTPADIGPWRYRWEAQEYADELNGEAVQS